ncbi:MAG: relaxase/mobilization nuclease domain-containing protein, partial [Pseudanabaena sp.]
HEHVHLVTSRVKMDGSVVSDSWDWTRSQKSIRKLEMDFGLASVPSSRTSDRQEETYPHIEKERISDKPTVKKQLANKISAALAYTKSLPDFIEQLNRDQIRVKVERDREGKPRGIAYKYEGVRLSGSSVGKAYSLPRILKQLEISASEIVKPNIYNLKPHISQVIMEQIKAGMAMPQFIEQIRQSGVDAYVKYTRNKKVKGISYSFGDNSIQGNELGKEFSWGGLQKYLQVSYDPVRDMPIILEMQGANSKATSQESHPQASEGLPDSLFAELALELERLRSLQLPNPIQPENVIENKISITPEHEGMDKAHLVAALCHQLLNELGADNFGKIGKNSYSIQRSGDTLKVENLRGDRQIILQVKGQEIEFANLSEFDIQQFEQARQLQKELKKEHWRDK